MSLFPNTMVASGAAALTLVVASPGHCAVEVRENGRLYVDGKPFVAIGLYSVEYVRDFPAIRRAGFNTVHSYGWEGGGGTTVALPEDATPLDVWIDEAHKNGLKAIIGLSRPQVKEMKFDRMTSRIGKYRNHPGLLSWSLMDEPSWDKPGDRGKDYMPAAYGVAKQQDPDHPASVVCCHYDDMELFMPSTDIMMADYYPVPPFPAHYFAGDGFRGIRTFADRARGASGGRKPFWFVVQIHDLTKLKLKGGEELPAEWQRPPNRDEIRCSTYTAIASGAQGVWFWSLGRLMGDAWNKDLLSRVERWEAVVEVVGELNELMPLLTAATPEAIQDKDHVVTMVKSDGRDTYVIAANYERVPASTEIDVPGVPRGAAEVVVGEPDTSAATIEEGAFRADFGPLETRVYRVREQP